MDGRSRCVPSSTDAVSSMKLKHEKMNLNLKESVCQNRYPASSNQKFVVQMKSSSLFVLRSSKVLERLLSGAVRSPRDRCSLATRWHWRCSGCNGGSERRNPICCRRKLLFDCLWNCTAEYLRTLPQPEDVTQDGKSSPLQSVAVDVHWATGSVVKGFRSWPAATDALTLNHSG